MSYGDGISVESFVIKTGEAKDRTHDPKPTYKVYGLTTRPRGFLFQKGICVVECLHSLPLRKHAYGMNIFSSVFG